jgi:calcium-translocating P-type ATPase
MYTRESLFSSMESPSIPVSDAYLLPAPEVLRRLRVRADQGLSATEVQRRAARYGTNAILAIKGRSSLFIFVERLTDPLVVVLIIAAIISVVLGEYGDAAIVAGAIVLDALLTFVQVWRTERTLEQLRDHIQPTALVMRGGRAKRIPADALVVGDVIEFRAGERVPADARLIEAKGLLLQEAALTGEADDVAKKTTRLMSRTPLANRTNMVYRGTTIVNGTGRAVVIATGTRTEFGRIMQMLKTETAPPSPLRRKLHKSSLLIGWIIAAAMVLLIAINLWQQAGVTETIRTAMTLAVSAVPEDLTMVLTVALTVGVVRILRRRGVVRQLNSVETLGAATVICADKTGTMTKGEMTATSFDFLQGTVLRGTRSPQDHWQQLALVGLALSSDAHRLNRNEATYIGSATERSALAFVEGFGFRQDQLRHSWVQHDALSFSPQWKYRAALHAHPSHEGVMLFVTGAPDVLLEHSSHRLNRQSEPEALTSEQRVEITRKIEERASQGERLMAVAIRRNYPRTDLTHRDIHSLTFVGILSINDPVRLDVRESIVDTQHAGIAVKLITGDHAATARAVARQVGLPATVDTICTGEALAHMNDAELNDAIDHITIFARVTPLDKQRIIRALQTRGHVVAMTGDGVNDAVALKAADIGVAMGSGKDIAKDAADLVLLDNSFVTIVTAIREGRVVRNNIRKVIAFLLSTNAAEVAIFFVSLLAGVPLPLLPAQILWINIVTDGTSDLALSAEPEESNVMRRRPENPHGALYDRRALWHIVFAGLAMTVTTFSLYWYALRITGVSLEYARTLAFVFLSVSSLLSVWSWRSLRESILRRGLWQNKWVPISAAFSFGLQLAAVYLPGFQSFFNTVPLAPRDWGIILVLALVTVAIIDLRKINFLKLSSQP